MGYTNSTQYGYRVRTKTNGKTWERAKYDGGEKQLGAYTTEYEAGKCWPSKYCHFASTL